MVGSENVESKAAQLGEDVRIGSNTRLVFTQGYVSDIVIAILYAPMIADALTKGFGAESRCGDVVGSLVAWFPIAIFCVEAPSLSVDLHQRLNRVPLVSVTKERISEDFYTSRLNPIMTLCGPLLKDFIARKSSCNRLTIHQ